MQQAQSKQSTTMKAEQVLVQFLISNNAITEETNNTVTSWEEMPQLVI